MIVKRKRRERGSRKNSIVPPVVVSIVYHAGVTVTLCLVSWFTLALHPLTKDFPVDLSPASRSCAVLLPQTQRLLRLLPLCLLLVAFCVYVVEKREEADKCN